MYLQALEIVGFKSFANKTRLVFEPGITAIVGPNGCGKSNVSDAIRWVLGEQRPTALRGSAMTDVIFNGTDSRKPLGMTEVSVTFADCEKQLGTEYNEVTITRRVFRSGEGQYFINRTPCRLRDIQRLFMDTGVGTSSYSVMAQGQIDAVLSSRPEDRRAIFEEASGITRFRADRKEAMRKLDQTDANLMRLGDVIRELHRQIGSLQRQAGKARRYKELQADLRKYDLYVTIERIKELDAKANSLIDKHDSIVALVRDLTDQVEAGEEANAAAREQVMELERQIGVAMEASMQAQGRRNQVVESIRINEQRILEYKRWHERDNSEISETRATRGIQQERIEQLAEQLEEIEGKLAAAEDVLTAARANFDEKRSASEATRNELQRLRNESVDLERTHARLQNELTEVQAAERENILKRERLASELESAKSNIASLEDRLDTVSGELETLNAMVDANGDAVSSDQSAISSINAQIQQLQQARASLQADIAVHEARIQFLTDAASSDADTPNGNRQLAAENNPLGLESGAVLGSLAERLSAPAEYRTALEASLRAWLDTIVVKDMAVAKQAIAAILASDAPASTRVVALAGANNNQISGETLPRLLECITCTPDFKPVAERLLGNVLVVADVAELPAELNPAAIYVTKNGAVFRGNGLAELWVPDSSASNPLARHMQIEDETKLLDELRDQFDTLLNELDDCEAKRTQVEKQLGEHRALLEQSSRAAAQKEGEERTIERDLASARARYTQVDSELKALGAAVENGSSRSKELAERINSMAESRTRIADAVAAFSTNVHEAEEKFLEAQSALTDARLAHASITQQNDNLKSQYNTGMMRLTDLDRLIEGRLAGLKAYDDSIAKLTAENQQNTDALDVLEEDVNAKNVKVTELRSERTTHQTALDQAERILHNTRVELSKTEGERNQLEVSIAEQSLRKQNIYDRLMIDWHLTPEQLVAEPPADWGEENPPDLATAEALIKDLRQKMDELGPVNLVAIEEYQEIEERHAFLVAQEADLTSAKAKLIDLIKEIDQKSTEMFKDTFEKANVNFQTMFTRLFNGGTAQLSLLDGEDILECGIDIVARPPGKKPLSVSQLSGGERTMTAVALLFAIYMIKPSPFALLDELDAALDDSNIGRFVGALKDFLELSQFLIITHNQHTIAGADIVYGVTQEEKGISKIISMRLKRIGVQELQEEELPEVAAPPPPSKRKMKRYEKLGEEE